MSQRIDQLRAALALEGVGAFLITGPVNRRYLSGFTGSAGWLLITPDEPFLLTDFRYVEQVQQQAPAFTLVECEDLVESLAELLGKLGITEVAVEAGHTTLHEQRRREERMPNVTWSPTNGVVERIRAVKEPAELRVIERAVALADEAFTYILDRLVGRTELEVAFDLEFFMRRNGAERLAFASIVASGASGALPHAVPSERRIEKGMLVTLDFGAVVEGYCSDMTRTVGVGPLDERQRDVYNLVLMAQEAGLKGVRPGRLGKEVDADARAVIEAAGYGDHFGHGLGHGVGMEVHEDPPRLSKRGEATLRPGMVTSVEPGVYIPDWGGVRIEDLVVVTENGCRVLTQSSKELVEL